MIPLHLYIIDNPSTHAKYQSTIKETRDEENIGSSMLKSFTRYAFEDFGVVVCDAVGAAPEGPGVTCTCEVVPVRETVNTLPDAGYYNQQVFTSDQSTILTSPVPITC